MCKHGTRAHPQLAVHASHRFKQDTGHVKHEVPRPFPVHFRRIELTLVLCVVATKETVSFVLMSQTRRLLHVISRVAYNDRVCSGAVSVEPPSSDPGTKGRQSRGWPPLPP